MSLLARISLSAVALAAGAVLLVAPSGAQAGTLYLSAYGWSATFDDNVDLTVLSTTNQGVVLSLQKFADFTSTGPLNIVFRQTSPSAVGQIAIEEETVINDSNVSWTGFSFTLSGDTEGANATFDDEASSGFSTSPFGAKNYLNGNKELRVSGGTLSSAGGSNIWRPGRDAGALFINADPFTSGASRQSFVFTEQPITAIPLPAAA